MKKFTFFLALLLSVLFTSGQNSISLQKRMEAAKEKYSLVSHQNSLVKNRTAQLMKMNLTSKNALKSVTSTMKLDSTVTKVWNDATQALENDTKEELLYDSEMKNTIWLYSDWNAASHSWIAWSKHEMLYNEDGILISINVLEAYEEGAELELITVSGVYYNDAGQLDSVLHWNVKNELIAHLEGKQVYHYDGAGRLIKMEIWALEEDEGEEYMSAMHFVFTYTNSGKIETSSMFLLYENEEMPLFKTEYYYDGSGRLSYTEDWSLNWMSPTFELEKSTRSDFEYNASGDVSTDTWSEWDQSGQAWVEIETDEYNYHNFNYSEAVFPSYLMLYGIVEEIPTLSKAIADIETIKWVEGTLITSEKTTFYYSAITNTFANRINESGFSVYPNPTRENVIFNWSENQQRLSLEIYQVTGNRILEKQISSGIPVSLAGIDNGIYFFKLNNGKQTLHSGKLIKK